MRILPTFPTLRDLQSTGVAIRSTRASTIFLTMAAVACLFLAAETRAQQNKMFVRDNLANVAGHLLFTSYDVLNYPTWGKDNLVVYRISQLLVQAGVTYALAAITDGWRTPLAFNLQWWTFNDDLLYYWMYDTIHGTHAFRDEVLANRVTWAWWTPYGLTAHGGRREPISGTILLTQAGVGFIFGVSLTL